MGILDRVRAAMIRRELRALEAADREAREGRTTHDMMFKIIEDTTRIVELQNRLRAIEGGEADEQESDFGTGIPTGFRAPSKRESEP